MDEITRLSLKIIQAPDERSIHHFAKRSILYWKAGRLECARADAQKWVLYANSFGKEHALSQFCLLMIDKCMKSPNILTRLKVLRHKFPEFKKDFHESWEMYENCDKELKLYNQCDKVVDKSVDEPENHEKSWEIVKQCATKPNNNQAEAMILLGDFQQASEILEKDETTGTPKSSTQNLMKKLIFKRGSFWQVTPSQSHYTGYFQEAHEIDHFSPLKYYPGITLHEILLSFAKTRNFETTETILNMYIQRHPGDHLAYLYRGFIYHLEDRIPRAISSCSIALNIAPRSNAARITRAIIKITASSKYKSEDASKTLLESALTDLSQLYSENTKNSVQISILTAYCYEKLGEHNEALQFVKNLVKLRNSEEDRLNLARCLYHCGHFPVLIALDTVNPEIIRMQELAYFELGKISANLLNECNRDQAEYIKACVDRTKLLEMPDTTKPIHKKWPSHEQVMVCRASAILENSDAEVALRILTSVKFSQVDERKFWVVLPYLVNLACCYQKLGFTARAYETLDKGGKLIDSEFLPAVEPGEKRYQMGRLIICATHIWKNMHILLKQAGLDPEDQIENWKVKSVLIEKQKHLFGC